ncbi:tetratricopeptide repeat protein [Xanthovirga aplysinae]|uniref:tetratricopeptide repeat protein n=1 Tax=Xanthovirga aplysinae TaxID=2529853 RepID=UPI0012BC9315|nr:tetratricopeptide repeat protein [Xanthovirga aplysinae]MTI31470.1 tetratricopeptide repeat protein [Xanthovirga aplysinae]
MSKSKIGLTLGAAALVVLLFNMPKVVVDNKNNEVPAGHSADDGHDHGNDAENEQTAAVTHFQGRALSEIESNQLAELKASYENSTSEQEKANFAISIAGIFNEVNQLDSAIYYAVVAAKQMPELNYWLKAGNAYYQAFQFAADEKQQQNLGKEVRKWYGKVLEVDPNQLEAKTNIAMTYIPTSNPMQGITMLREVLEVDPNNEAALFNMGALSIQSGQYERAIQRFEHLLSLYPENVQAHLLLGISYKETGNKKRAAEHFETVKKLDNDPSVQAAADSYLEDLTNN